MDILDEALLNFWGKLNYYGVKYLMVGGLATRFYGFNRQTDDLDLWLDDKLENRQKLRKAFADLGYGDYASLENMVFIPGWTSFYAAGIELDIMTSMIGLEENSFETCYEQAKIFDIGPHKVPFIHINHLIANKKAVNRPKDQIDVLQLEEIKRISEKSNL
jgi:hypothetical protein